MSSIRARLLLSLGLCITVILTLSFAAVHAFVAGSLRKNYDEELARKARAFALMA